MTETRTRKIIDAVPVLKSKWWTAVLVLSLMANLLVIGAIGGHFANGRNFGGVNGSNFVQLIPRKFFEDLNHQRRRELMMMLRNNRGEFRQMRINANAAAMELAAALESPDYNAAAVQAVIDKFATGHESLAAKGGTVVVDIIAKLTPKERKALAAAIRDRSLQSAKRE